MAVVSEVKDSFAVARNLSCSCMYVCLYWVKDMSHLELFVQALCFLVRNILGVVGLVHRK